MFIKFRIEKYIEIMWGKMRKCKVIPPKPGCKFNKHQTASDKVDDVDNQIHPQYEHLHLYYMENCFINGVFFPIHRIFHCFEGCITQ